VSHRGTGPKGRGQTPAFLHVSHRGTGPKGRGQTPAFLYVSHRGTGPKGRGQTPAVPDSVLFVGFETGKDEVGVDGLRRPCAAREEIEHRGGVEEIRRGL
jgi:hypothetical protein